MDRYGRPNDIIHQYKQQPEFDDNIVKQIIKNQPVSDEHRLIKYYPSEITLKGKKNNNSDIISSESSY